MIKEFFNLFKSKNAQEPSVPAAVISQVEHSRPKKPRKPKAKKEKVVAPKVEPKVDILKFDFDPTNPRLGSIELDWNTEFVQLLIEHGYVGATEEEVIDKWLNDVCRTIIANQFPGTSTAASGATIVNRKNLGSGKTEIS